MTEEAAWLADLEQWAADHVDPALLDYIVSGAREGRSAARAIDSWAELDLYPRVLRDVSVIDASTTPLGRFSPGPWGIAPTTLQRVVHPDGELGMARAVAGTGTVYVVSSNAGTRFVDIGATGCRWWLQLYLPHDRELARSLLDRAVRAGAEAVVLTLDTPVVGTKYPHHATDSIWSRVHPSLVRVNFDPGYEDQAGGAKSARVSWLDLAWVRDVSGLPVVAKGVLRADDAMRCVQAGASAVWVSNHGGRQLDRTVSTARALAPVVAALDGTAQVYVDGGVRGGLDLVAGLALGADLVFLGRTPLLALAQGEAGVARMGRELDLQVEETLRLLGCADVAASRGCAFWPPAQQG